MSMSMSNICKNSTLVRLLYRFFKTRRHQVQKCSLSSTSALNVQVYASMMDALGDVRSGATILVGGYGICGIPEKLLEHLSQRNISDLTIISNNASIDNYGLGMLIKNRQVKKLIASYVGENEELIRQYRSGEIQLEYTPEGTLVERIRAAGAGIAAFYTATGFGTLVGDGGLPIKFHTAAQQQQQQAKQQERIEIASASKESRKINGINCVLEEALCADFALIKAWKADTHGNLVFRYSAGNFNAAMCKAAKVSIVEVEEIVEAGSIPPNDVHVPSIYCDRLVLGEQYKKPIERLMYKKCDEKKKKTKISLSLPEIPAAKTRNLIAQRAALEFKHGFYVNLNIGIPTLCLNFIPEGIRVNIQSENGLIGVDDYPEKGTEDADLINAQKETITLRKGSSAMCSDEAFGIIRGGHLDLIVLDAFQVSKYGDIANWLVPDKFVKGIGAKMDLASAHQYGTRVVVAMEHTRKGKTKILNKCTLPLTGLRCASRIITEMAVFDVDPHEGLTLIEVREDLSVEDIIENTGCDFNVSPNLQPMRCKPSD